MTDISQGDPAFPAHPNVEKQPWVAKLSPSNRAEYEKIRRDGIKTDVKILIKVIRDYPGFSSISDEEVEHLARRWATNLADTWDEGKQRGLELHQPETDRLRAFAYQSIQNVAG